jgi:hypothetical protein
MHVHHLPFFTLIFFQHNLQLSVAIAEEMQIRAFDFLPVREMPLHFLRNPMQVGKTPQLKKTHTSW